MRSRDPQPRAPVTAESPPASGATRARPEALFASTAYQARPTWLKDEEIKKVVDKSRANVRDAIIKGVPTERRVDAKIKQLRR